MPSCAVCHRLARGFANRGKDYCSMECMNSGCVVPPEPWDSLTIFKFLDKPANELTENEAVKATQDILGWWQTLCREAVGIDCTYYHFTPWHHEDRFVKEAMFEADTGDLVRSIVTNFNKKCRDYTPA